MDEKRVLAIQFELDCLQMAHDCLKDEQRKVILKILEGNQCFISLQTGYGKSLIFQVLPFAIVFEYYRRYEDIPLRLLDYYLPYLPSKMAASIKG